MCAKDAKEAQTGADLIYPLEGAPKAGAAEVVEVAEGILWARMPLPMALNHVNVYALADADGWTIVDTGLGLSNIKQAWQALLEGPLAGRPVVRVLATHHHLDHLGLVGWFQTEHGAELLTSRTAWLFARMLQLDEQERPPEETLNFWRRAGMDAEILAQRETERPLNYADVVAPMPLGFTQLVPGQVLRLAGRNWTVRFGQGHAPDHVTLWCEDEPLVIGGDQLLPTISPNIGVYATEPDANPLEAWLQACADLAPFATDDQLVLPGHGRPFRGLPLRLKQLVAEHHQALDQLRTLLAQPHSAAECFPALYSRKIGAGEYGLALVEAIAHVNYLAHRGEIKGELRADGAMLWRMA